jgi:hypothetical protein
MSSRTSQPKASTGDSPGRSLRRMIATRKPLVGIVGVLAVAILLGTAYVLGAPPSVDSASPTTQSNVYRDAVNPAQPEALDGWESTGVDSEKSLVYGPAEGDGAGGATVPATATDGVQIVKTGSMTLEVDSIDNALAQAQATIEGLGGYVASSNRYGSGDETTASITFRLPVARWDDALKAMRALGGKIISEQTSTADVTSQVVDLDARITNLRATETALLAIMEKATEIKDILAVQEQLTQTRSQIEQLTAQRDHFKDQAAMSTLSVAFILPPKTVTTVATNEWDFNNQVDQAVAALVRIGQGLATIGVWLLIVGLPVLGSLLVLWILYRIVRRVTRRSQAAA